MKANFYPFAVELKSPSIAIKTGTAIHGMNLKALSADLILKGLKRMFGGVSSTHPITEVEGGVIVHEYNEETHVILFVKKDHSDLDLETILIMDEAFKDEYELPKNLAPKLCLQAKFKSEYFENLPPRYSVTLLFQDNKDSSFAEEVRQLIKEEIRRELLAFECKLETIPKEPKTGNILMGNIFSYKTSDISIKLAPGKDKKLVAKFDFSLTEFNIEQLFPILKEGQPYAGLKGILFLLPEERVVIVRLSAIEDYALPYFLDEVVRRLKTTLAIKGKLSFLATEVRLQVKKTETGTKASLIILYPEESEDIGRLETAKAELSEALAIYGHSVHLKQEPRSN